MRIVLDTNVLISGIFFGGPPARILQSWIRKAIQIVLTEQIFEEYRRVGEELATKFPSINIDPILEFLPLFGEFVETRGMSETICDDPDDNKFIECALAGRSKLIVSGDKHLLKISGYKGIEVLRPREFVDTYLQQNR